MLKAILFDMDGVIVDSEPLHQKAYYKMFAHYGIDVDDRLYQSFTGQATLPICEHLCAHFELGVPATDLVAQKRIFFKEFFDNDSDFQLIDGVLPLIQAYHQSGLTLVLASSASMPNINQIFERFDLNQYFTAKISGADLAASKPHPEIFLKAAAAAGCQPSECVVIEDATNGIKAAKAAGIFCVAFQSDHSHGQNYDLADTVISDFNDIYPESLFELFPK